MSRLMLMLVLVFGAIAPASHAAESVPALPELSSKREWPDGYGHLPEVELPAKVNELIRAFLGG